MNKVSSKITFILFFLFFLLPNISLAQVSAGETGNCLAVGMQVDSISGCLNIKCCDGVCKETGVAPNGNKYIKCSIDLLPGQECNDGNPCSIGKSCEYFSVAGTSKTKCMASSEIDTLKPPTNAAKCIISSDCPTGNSCIRYGTNFVKAGEADGYCWPQASVDSLFPQTTNSPTTTAGGYTPPAFVLQKPVLEIPIPTLPTFSDVAVQGDTGSRFLDIPWIYEYIVAVYKYGVVLAVAIAILMMMIGGILRIISSGNPGDIKNANSFIISPIIGLFILLSSYLMLYVINPKTLEYQTIKVDIVEPVPLEMAVFDDNLDETPQYGGKAESITSTTYDEIFKNYAACINVDYRLLKTFAYKESSLNPSIKNKYGYIGLFQTKESNCKDALAKYNATDKCSDLYNPDNNTAVGAALMKINLDKIRKYCPNVGIEDFIALVYTGHNSGPGALQDALNKQACTRPTLEKALTEFWTTYKKGKYIDTVAKKVPGRVNYAYNTAKTASKLGVTDITGTKQGTCPW